MIRHILLIVSLVAPLGAWAKASPPKEQRQSLAKIFFLGLEASIDDELVTYPERKKNNAIEEKFALRVQELGLNVMNAQEHGVRQEEFRVRKANRGSTAIPVMHFNVQNVRRAPFWAGYKFDVEFARGSEFFAEQESAILHDCKGIEKRDGRVDINLEGCIRDYYKRVMKQG